MYLAEAHVKKMYLLFIQHKSPFAMFTFRSMTASWRGVKQTLPPESTVLDKLSVFIMVFSKPPCMSVGWLVDWLVGWLVCLL